MLTHLTLAMLADLGLHGMAAAFKDLQSQPEARTLEHGDWLAPLLEHEATLRHQKRFGNRARAARLRHDAHVEDVDFRAAGVRKSWLACTLGQNACREDFSVAYHHCLAPFGRIPLQMSEGEMGGAGKLCRQPSGLANSDMSQGHPDRSEGQARVEGLGDPDLEDEARRGAREVVRHVYNPVYIRAGGTEKPGISGGSENGGGSVRHTSVQIHLTASENILKNKAFTLACILRGPA